MAKRKRSLNRKMHSHGSQTRIGERSGSADIDTTSTSNPGESGFEQLLKIRHFQAAIEIWERELQENSPTVRRMAQAAHAYFQLDRVDRGLEILRQAVALDPGQPALWLGLADALTRTGDTGAAEESLHGGLQHNPNSRHLASSLARLLYQQSRLEDALSWIESSCSQTTAEVDDWLLAADIYRDLERWSDATRVYQRLLDGNPEFIPAIRGGAVVLAEQGQHAQAIEQLKRAIALDPSQPKTWLRLGLIQRLADEFREAIDSLRQTIALDPECTLARETLGRIHQELGEIEPARAVFNEWLQLQRDNPIATHMLAALSGQAAPDRASDDYVATVFDDFANSFDAVLKKLNYQVPRIIADSLIKLRLIPNRSLCVLDAGCGTGLCGPILRPYASRLIGVDLSENMLACAKRRGDFDELHHAELVEFLNRTDRAYDLIVSADTLNYFGNLEHVFAAARNALGPSGHLVFTLEKAHQIQPTQQRFVLNAHGRYSHSVDYVREQVQQHGLRLIDLQSVVLRTENDRPVDGWLWVVSL